MAAAQLRAAVGSEIENESLTPFCAQITGSDVRKRRLLCNY